jgi:two-component system, sensor histidine kinase and response regulator
MNEVKLNLELFDENVYGIESELDQVILNIINNAIDAFKDKEIKDKEININVLTKKSYTILIIEDSAGGVEPNNFEKLFDPYYTTKLYGTGTGLYMVKLVIKNSFGGDLKVNNTEKGLRYIIALPQKKT